MRGGGTMFLMKCMYTYQDIISVENLLASWRGFKNGKTKKKDVQVFERYLMDNILSLHEELSQKTYTHSSYTHFVVADPKRRDIHKALVRDRVVHHALYRALYPYFDQQFIHDSYSCRKLKGTHKAFEQFSKYADHLSCNNTKTVFVLKCDIRKFFASINHEILKEVLAKYIEDKDIQSLLENIIESFYTPSQSKNATYSLFTSMNNKYTLRGLPLGNLTSQRLVNIYMHEFDSFMKQELRVEYYIRYADDFVVLSRDRKYLEEVLVQMEIFLRDKLKLAMHPDKVYIKTYASGVDFLGWVHFPHHRVLRAVTRRRMVAKLKISDIKETKSAYRGMLSHGNTQKLKNTVGL